ELLDHVAPHFSDCNLEHYLIAPTHGNSVHNFVAVADQPCCKIVRLLRFLRVRSVTGEHDTVANSFDTKIGIRYRLFQSRPYAIEVALDRNVEAGDLLAFGIEEENIGLPDGNANHVNAARRPDHGIGDLRVGYQHILDVGRQIDRNRFADPERDEA